MLISWHNKGDLGTIHANPQLRIYHHGAKRNVSEKSGVNKTDYKSAAMLLGCEIKLLYHHNSLRVVLYVNENQVLFRMLFSLSYRLASYIQKVQETKSENRTARGESFLLSKNQAEKWLTI